MERLQTCTFRHDPEMKKIIHDHGDSRVMGNFQKAIDAQLQRELHIWLDKVSGVHTRQEGVSPYSIFMAFGSPMGLPEHVH